MRPLRKALAVLRLLVSFVADLLASSWALIRIILSPEVPTHPAIVAMPTTLERPWAVAMLAYFTSLTPGATCLHVSEDRRVLYLHMLDAADSDAQIAAFRRLYERPIAELER